MVGPGGAGPDQHQRGSQIGRVARGRTPLGAAVYSSWMVVSLITSNSRRPLGVGTSTSSPTSFPTSARPIGDAVEIMPLGRVGILRHDQLIHDGGATDLLQMHRRPERDLVRGQPVEVHQGQIRDPFLEQADLGLDQTLPLLGRLILGVLSQVTVLPGPLNLLGKIVLELTVQSLDLVLETFE